MKEYLPIYKNLFVVSGIVATNITSENLIIVFLGKLYCLSLISILGVKFTVKFYIYLFITGITFDNNFIQNSKPNKLFVF